MTKESQFTTLHSTRALGAVQKSAEVIWDLHTSFTKIVSAESSITVDTFEILKNNG